MRDNGWSRRESRGRGRAVSRRLYLILLRDETLFALRGRSLGVAFPRLVCKYTLRSAVTGSLVQCGRGKGRVRGRMLVPALLRVVAAATFAFGLHSQAIILSDRLTRPGGSRQRSA